MRLSIVAAIAGLIAIAGCKKKKSWPEPGDGRVVVSITVDWEGAYLADQGLEALATARLNLGDAPVTHFVTPAYYTKVGADAGEVTKTLRANLGDGDEIALHIHAWKSLVIAAGVEPRYAPSFLGSGQLMEFENDVGYEVELAAYEPDEITAILAHGKKLLTDAGFEVAPALRVGGAVATPQVLEAARRLGFEIDSSATAAKLAANEPDRAQFAKRVAEVWPDVTATTQPFEVKTAAGAIREMPFVFADYMTAKQLGEAIDRARDLLAKAPERDVFVDIMFHQETAHEFAQRVVEAIAAARSRHDGALVFATKSGAAARVSP